jgi:glutamate formiminotransferase
MIAYSPAPVIAAMIQRARRKIVTHFFVHHAFGAEDAVPFVPGNAIMRRQFEEMRKRGIVRDGPSGNFWIDTAAYQADRDRRHRRLVPIVLVLALLAAAIPLFFYR